MSGTNNKNLMALIEPLLRHPLPQPGSTQVPTLAPKTQDFVIAILSSGNFVNKTRLQKLAFLTEVEFIENTGERITDLDFLRWNFGPFSSDLQNAATSMHETVELKEHPSPYDPSRKETVFRLLDDTPMGALAKDRFEFVVQFCGTFRYYPTEKLISRSKGTDMFQSTGFGNIIDLDKMANDVKRLMKKLDNSRKFAARAKHLTNVRKIGRVCRYPTCAAYIRKIL
jgi:hypothetical protein